jgi:SET domain-containing protein
VLTEQWGWGKTATRVMQSGIQGKGLFAVRDYAPSDMVIEYVGEVVGQRVADQRYVDGRTPTATSACADGPHLCIRLRQWFLSYTHTHTYTRTHAHTLLVSTCVHGREALYEHKCLGTYMFRLDHDRIIDATFAGNAARFINHSCAVRVAHKHARPAVAEDARARTDGSPRRGGATELWGRWTSQPNCYARIVVVEGEKKVVIFADRVIRAGEEFTYDYKLPIEQHKLLCHCGAATCRGTMN